MNITIVAYRPDHTDYCRGCRMGSTESDMECQTFDTTREATEFLAKYMAKNKIRDIYEYAEYDFTFVVNGLDEMDWEPDSVEQNIQRRIFVAAIRQSDEIATKYEEDKAAKEAEDKRIKEEKTRELELKQLAILQEKHGKG